MIQKSLFLLLFVSALPVFAQTDVVRNWKIEASKDSGGDFFKDPRQAEVVYFTNLARTHPALFITEFLEPYSDSIRVADPELYRKEKRYIESLKSELSRLQPMQPLQPDPRLTKLAFEHADYSGRTGKVGHIGKNGKGFSQRMKEGGIDSACGENCDYGRDTAFEVFMSLLVDEGIRDLGHRKNILNPDYSRIGVGWAGHKTYRVNCVIHYASGEVTP